MNAKEV